MFKEFFCWIVFDCKNTEFYSHNGNKKRICYFNLVFFNFSLNKYTVWIEIKWEHITLTKQEYDQFLQTIATFEVNVKAHEEPLISNKKSSKTKKKKWES